ncbi:MAG: hypothetical protein R2875_03480 [Desulfobacterales bacterium]
MYPGGLAGKANDLYEYFSEKIREKGVPVQTGQLGP